MAKRPQGVAMSVQSFKDKLKLLRKWGYLCIVCGRPFANVACVTVEHIQPLSGGGRNNKANTAPSHHSCNKTKGKLPLMTAAQIIDSLEKRYGVNFPQWLNQRVPNRPVPDYALLPILDAEWFAL